MSDAIAQHVVTGAGPVGHTVATQLAQAGHPVRVLTRSGSGPQHPLVERVRVDVGDERALRAAVGDAHAVFHCVHAPYTLRAWQDTLPAMEQAVLQAAGEAVVVFPESLYSYARPDTVMTEDGPRTASGGKRGVRSALLAARAASRTPTVSVVASDFFGPHALNAHAGEHMVPTVLAGRRVRVMAGADTPHSFTYVPDLARAMVAAAARPDLHGSVLHAPTGPALTQRQLVHAFAAAAGVAPKVGVIPAWVVRAAGLLPGALHEMTETLYQFTAPFVMDSARSDALLGLAPTPLDQAASETVQWWRARAA